MPSEETIAGYTLHLPDPGSNVGWVRVDEVFIMFARGGTAPEERMNQVIEGLAQPGVKAMVGASLGSLRLKSTQRKQLLEAAGGKRLVSIMDANPITRGIVTALRWFGLKIHLVGWSELDKALSAMDPDGRSTDTLRVILEAIYAHLSEEPQILDVAS